MIGNSSGLIARLMAILWVMCPIAARAFEIHLYVAPGGNDAWSGRLPAPGAGNVDGPFATPRHAAEAVRALRQASGTKLPAPTTIALRGGTYWLSEPLMLGPEDSGTADSPVTWAAFEGEAPILSAGRRVEGWHMARVGGKDAWAAILPGDGTPREFWVNGGRRIRARYPKKGYLKVESVPKTATTLPKEQGPTRFRFHSGDIQASPGITGAELIVMSVWVESRLPIASVEEKDRTVNFTRRGTPHLSAGDLYYMEGSADFLDDPGEWCFDEPTRTLSYRPFPGETMEATEAVVPRLQQVIRLEGKPTQGQFVEHVTFRGLSFSHSEWYFAPPIPEKDGRLPTGGFPQAAVGVPGAVLGNGVRDCSFEHCRFNHLGNYGLELAQGCQNNHVAACTFNDMGAGGIKIGETAIRHAAGEQAAHNQVSDCRIFDGGHVFPSAVGIWIGQSPDNLLSHNAIHDLYYSGISIGWTWGYGKALATGNLVEYNDVNHIGITEAGDGPILSDMGGIYTLGDQHGTVIRLNRFHDIAARRYGGWGIYFDEGTSEIVAENNLVYHTTHGGFHQHYGRDNIVRNNIFAFGRDAQIRRTRIEDHISFTFERNIVYWDHGSLLDGAWDTRKAHFDHNTYWRDGGGDIQFGKLKWDEWRADGEDQHSQIANPQFANPEKGNFNLHDGSPPVTEGFVPFDLSKVGPQINE